MPLASKCRAHILVIRRSVSSSVTHNTSSSTHARAFSPNSEPSIQRKKYSPRGGRNLSERYHRLERSLQRKEARRKELYELERHQAIPLVHEVPPGSTLSTITSVPPTQVVPIAERTRASGNNPGVQTFRGLLIPRKPDPPADDGEYSMLIVFPLKTDTHRHRVLHVRLCHMRIRSLRRKPLCIRGIYCCPP